jgi:toxin ParE1/3/4
MTRIVFLAPAEEEMLEAAAYYASQAEGLGHNFLAAVQQAAARIVGNPRLGQIVRGDIRRRLLRRFPFGLLYRIDPEEIVIIAVMHLRRRPEYWADRM